jgi:hypothetical protein
MYNADMSYVIHELSASVEAPLTLHYAGNLLFLFLFG